MPVTLKPTVLKYRNGHTFTEADCLKGSSGVHYGTTPPTDPDVNVWVDPSGTETTFVQDVQIDGTSIMSQGVAEVPLATSSVVGVNRPGNTMYVTSAGAMGVNVATSSHVKTGTAQAFFLTPNAQHESTFYGLAKASGDNTQSESSNAVGTYTDEAKVAIQKMLGLYQPPFELIRDITLNERTSIDVAVDDNGLPFELLSVFIEIYYPANLTSEDSGYGRFRFYDDNNDYVIAETGRYITNTLTQFKNIFLQRFSNMTLCKFTRQASTGGYSSWSSKCVTNRGMKTTLGNIVHIVMDSADYEPSGANIKIWGQRAY